MFLKDWLGNNRFEVQKEEGELCVDKLTGGSMEGDGISERFQTSCKCIDLVSLSWLSDADSLSM